MESRASSRAGRNVPGPLHLVAATSAAMLNTVIAEATDSMDGPQAPT